MIINLTIGGNTKRSKLGQHEAVIDWNQVPDEAQAFIIRYGLKQYLADGIAGAETVEDAAEGVKERVRKVLEADFARARGEGSAKPDSVEVRALRLAKDAVKAKAKAGNVKLDKEQIEETAKAWIAASPKFTKQAEAELAAAAALLEDDFEIPGMA